MCGNLTGHLACKIQLELVLYNKTMKVRRKFLSIQYFTNKVLYGSSDLISKMLIIIPNIGKISEESNTATHP